MITLLFDVLGGEVPTSTFDLRRLVVVGFAGREQDAVEAHVVELAAAGIPAPAEVPVIWDVAPELAQQHGHLNVRAGRTSGEVEAVLLFDGADAYVTVGSDHTDRELERTSLENAKAACARPLAKSCWPLSTVRDEWDDLVLSSSVRVGGAWRPYQLGRLRELLPLDWYLEQFRDSDEAGTAVLCGTVPLRDGLVLDASAFRGTLTSFLSGRALSLEYEVDAT